MNRHSTIHDEVASELIVLISLDPSVEAERAEWTTVAARLKTKLDYLESFGDFERDKFFYAGHFVTEGATFSRHPDYYNQERTKIRHLLNVHRG